MSCIDAQSQTTLLLYWQVAYRVSLPQRLARARFRSKPMHEYFISVHQVSQCIAIELACMQTPLLLEYAHANLIEFDNHMSEWAMANHRSGLCARVEIILCVRVRVVSTTRNAFSTSLCRVFSCRREKILLTERIYAILAAKRNADRD